MLINCQCMECNKDFIKDHSQVRGKNFCSRSCAVTFNNRNRIPKNPCKCGKKLPKKVKLCLSCKRDSSPTTLREIKYSAKYQKYAYVRLLARKNRDSLPQACQYCGYSTHVEVCHIKSIGSFSDDSLLSEINHIDNLLILCPNHHWEFDNGILSIKQIVPELHR